MPVSAGGGTGVCRLRRVTVSAVSSPEVQEFSYQMAVSPQKLHRQSGGSRRKGGCGDFVIKKPLHCTYF